MREELSVAIEGLEVLLARLPGPARAGVTERLAELRRLVLDQRPPRFALVGRRGSGKSSLINAIFGRVVAPVGHERATTGRARWERFAGELGEIEILDTRGLQEGAPPTEDDPASSAEASILAALEQSPPDALLFLVKATEADAAIHADLDALGRIAERIAKAHGGRAPVVAVLTHADTVEPKNVALHAPDTAEPADLREKLDRLGRLESLLADRFGAHQALAADLVAVTAVSSYQSWRPDGTRRDDERWRIDRLLTYLMDELPEEARVGLARLSQVTALRRDVARRVVNATAAVAAGVAAVPIPVADVVPLTALQVQMVVAIAHLGGRRLDARGGAEFLAAMGLQTGAAMGLREVARQIAKLLPGVGSVVNAGVASAGTKAIGEAAIAWFVDGTDRATARRRAREAKGG